MYNDSEIEQKLINLLENHGIVLNFADDREKNIFDYGLDSLGFVSLMVEMEEEFNIDIDDSYLNRVDFISIHELVELVSNCKKSNI